MLDVQLARDHRGIDHIWLTGEVDEVADWLQQARDTRLDLCWNTGWAMKLRFSYTRRPIQAFLVSLWWEPDLGREQIIGPLPSLGLTLKEWATKNGLDT